MPNKWSKGNKLRGMSFKELERLSDSLFDYEDELDEYEGKITSLIAATPQGFAARQEDIDYLMTVVGRVRHTIINMQEAVDKTIEITTSDDEEEYFDPDDKAQLEKLFNSKTVKDAIAQIKKDRLDAMDEAIPRLFTLTPLDSPEAIDAIDALRYASLAMMRDIQRSDTKQPKQLMHELFGV